jgi:phosphoribosylformimino-5-aminoimidazole carboxamide ribotide isomerase
MRIILAIDVIDGKCVRLTKGDYSTRKIYNTDPLEVAKQAEYNGIKYIHLVDLEGAAVGRPVNLNLVEKLTSKTSMKIDFGGGIKTTRDLDRAFDYGAAQVTGGSVAVNNPDLFLSWLSKFGAEKIILGADSKGRMILTDGWKKSSGLEIPGFIKDYSEKGVKYTICTDIEKDGMLQGPSLQLYREILQSAPINLIASGGISSIKDIDDLEKTGCDGAIIGKAFYEGIITLKELGKRC